jgi:uncharacterized protein YfcZ (UPF0381/DUF406 family)
MPQHPGMTWARLCSYKVAVCWHGEGGEGAGREERASPGRRESWGLWQCEMAQMQVPGWLCALSQTHCRRGCCMRAGSVMSARQRGRGARSCLASRRGAYHVLPRSRGLAEAVSSAVCEVAHSARRLAVRRRGGGRAPRPDGQAATQLLRGTALPRLCGRRRAAMGAMGRKPGTYTHGQLSCIAPG